MIYYSIYIYYAYYFKRSRYLFSFAFEPRGFPDSSVGKESACNAGDPGLIPRLGRSPGLDGRESGWTLGVGDGQGGLVCCDLWGRKESDTTEWLNWLTDWPTPVFLGFPVAQLVKNLPAMWDTWVRSLGWEDPLEKGKATHSSTLAWRIPWTVCKELDTTDRLSLSLEPRTNHS